MSFTRNRSGLWVPEELRRKAWNRWPSVSDVNALISIPLSILAVYLSVRGYVVNKESLVVGQRAYVSIKSGELMLAAIRQSDNQDPFRYELNCRFVLQNLGNTPATIGPIKLEYYIRPDWRDEETNLFDEDLSFDNNPFDRKRGKKDLKKKTSDSVSTSKRDPNLVKHAQEVPPEAYSRQLGPKAEILFSLPTNWFPVPEDKNKPAVQKRDTDLDAWSRSLENEMKPIILKGSFVYQDVFDFKHTVQWCWVTAGYMVKFPEDCSADDLKRIPYMRLIVDPKTIMSHTFLF